MLNENDSNALYNKLSEIAGIQESFAIVQGTGAKFGVDGDHYYYGFGHPAEPDGVFGYGKTPVAALNAFNAAYFSQTVNTARVDKPTESNVHPVFEPILKTIAGN